MVSPGRILNASNNHGQPINIQLLGRAWDHGCELLTA